jgi:hypothetical protein
VGIGPGQNIYKKINPFLPPEKPLEFFRRRLKETLCKTGDSIRDIEKTGLLPLINVFAEAKN